MNACAAMEIQIEIQMDIVPCRYQHTFDIQTRNIADKNNSSSGLPRRPVVGRV